MSKQFTVRASRRSGTIIDVLVTAASEAEARRRVQHEYDASVQKVAEITFNAPQSSPWKENDE